MTACENPDQDASAWMETSAATMTEAMMLMDLLVQIAVSTAVLVMVILFVVTLDARVDPRERVLRRLTGTHWWNRTRHGPD